MRAHLLPILKRIRKEYGDEALLNPERLRSFLLDLLRNEYPGEIEIVVMLLARGVVRRLQREEPLSDEKIDSLADYLARQWFFQKEPVEEALKCWNDVLQIWRRWLRG